MPARLHTPRDVAGGTAWTIEADSRGEGLFRGPDDCDWASFRLEGEDEATFEWRTGADHVRRIAERLVRRRTTFGRAVRDPFVARWLTEERLEAFEDVDGEDERARRLLTEIGPRVRNVDGLDGFYGEDDYEDQAADATAALDLPAWAELDSESAGGPGTGYTETLLVLRDGRTLRDLAAWLEARERRSPQPVDFLPWVALPTRGRLGLTHRPGAFVAGSSPDADERLERDVRSLARGHGASSLVTLLDPFELANAGRIDLAARRAGMRWSHYPVPDQATPTLEAARRKSRAILRDLRAGRTVVLHCKAGLGRSGTLAACVLVEAGMSGGEAIRAVREARPGAVESAAQEVFVREFAEGWRAS
jgi:protein-tyrosine phosphatase